MVTAKNLSTQQGAERDLSRLAAIVESSSDAIISTNLDGMIESWNDAARRIYGYSRDEVLGQPISILIPPDRVVEIADILERIARGERVDHFESVRLDKQGRTINISLAVSPITDPDGRIVGASAIARDVTERKLAEEALRKSEARSRLLAQITERMAAASDVPVDELCSIVARHLDCEFFANYLVDEPDGGLRLQTCAGFPDDERDRIEWVRFGEGVCGTVARQGTRMICQNLQQQSDPQTATIRRLGVQAFACHPLKSDRGILGTLAFGTTSRPEFLPDELQFLESVASHVAVGMLRILERQQLRESEERMRSILNTATDAIVTIDRRGIITGINPATERMFGYTRQDLIGSNVSLLMPAPYSEEHDGYIERYLRTGEARMIGIGRELMGRHKQGYLFPIDLAVSEVDHLHMFTGIIRDISERKALQGHLLTIAAEEQRRIGQDLHDGVGQQILALGITARTLAEMLKEASLTDRYRDLADKLARGLKDALAQVRTLSRGLVPVDVEAEGLMAALRELADDISCVHGISCTFCCSQPVRITDSQKATHLYRIAQEAVTNAVKHAQTDQIRIGLDAAEHTLTLTVQDNGVGMPATIPPNGGIGLKTMQYRASLIGGQLTIRPLDQQGTLVTCTVPLER